MKYIALVVFVCACFVAGEEVGAGYWRQFNKWASQHNKHYATHADKLMHYEEFVATAEFVEAFNAVKSHSFTVALNEFSDYTTEQWASMLMAPREVSKKGYHYQGSNKITPIDWRDEGAVTPVKNQKECGSCWAFSTTGVIESATEIATGELISLSEQQLIDCSRGRPYNNDGCFGGEPVRAMDYVIDAGGLASETDYPYLALHTMDEACQINSSSILQSTIAAYKQISKGSETELQSALLTEPVSICIDASLDSFHSYHSGVYYNTSCSKVKLDHCILAVGMGHDDTSGMDYYIVKNSWGLTWGMEGYGWMAANKDNACGIATDASYPTGAKLVKKL